MESNTLDNKTYLQYKNEDGEKICLIFRSPKKAEDFILKNKIGINNITYYSFKKFPFRQHCSISQINNAVNYFSSNRTSKRFKEVI